VIPTSKLLTIFTALFL